MEDRPLPERSWNKKPARAILVMAGFILGGFVLVYFAMTAWYWWRIKQGDVVAPVRPEITLEGNGEFRQSVKTISPNADVDRKKIESGPFLTWGGSTAKLTIVQFVDFKCPFSKEAAEAVQKMMSRYAGKINLYVRNFPGESVYPGSRELSRVAYCSFRQNRFPKVYAYLFEHQSEILPPLTDESISTIASATGLYEKDLRKCLTDTMTDQKVAEDLSVGVGAGVRGTPTFFVNGQKLEGAIPFEAWQRFIDAALLAP